ncbi:MAG: right-handed parallel beta-helix repeat-containing protein [Planctomycetes bacterium]|nr:right-handed parallel beta-helix repeat-containing protein [Planctomycetota bacterium]
MAGRNRQLAGRSSHDDKAPNRTILPLLERLEARLLLSADFIGPQQMITTGAVEIAGIYDVNQGIRDSGQPSQDVDVSYNGAATVYYVSKSGRDSNAGTQAEPWLTIQHAASNVAPGDTVIVGDGIYEEHVNFSNSGTEGAPITFVSENGPTGAKIYGSNGGRTLQMDHVTDIIVDGFDVYSSYDTGRVSDGMVHLWYAQRITIRDCYIHDAGTDTDCVKFSYSQDIVFENDVIWDPAHRLDGEHYQENMDIRSNNDGVTIRGCWFFHDKGGDYLLYAKGASTNLLWENNIFGSSAGLGWGNVPVETGHLSSCSEGPYCSSQFVVRNNLFYGARDAANAAFAFAGPDTALLYNNVFYGNETVNRAMIEISQNMGTAGGPAVDIYCFNNIFYDNGTMGIYHVRDTQSGNNLVRDYNLFYQSGDGKDLSLSLETNSVIEEDPLFVNPTDPVFDINAGTGQIADILEGFKVSAGSPAIDAGVDPLVFAGAHHPDGVAEMLLKYDAFMTVRPQGAGFDIGLHEYGDIYLSGDTDRDGDVDATDLAQLGVNWAPSGTGKQWSQGDFDDDGDVDAADLAALGLNWAPSGYGSPAGETDMLLAGDADDLAEVSVSWSFSSSDAKSLAAHSDADGDGDAGASAGFAPTLTSSSAATSLEQDSRSSVLSQGMIPSVARGRTLGATLQIDMESVFADVLAEWNGGLIVVQSV